MQSAANGLVVIGSGPAGNGAARAYREAGGRGPVRIVSSDVEPPYLRPPLSKEFLRAEAGDDDLPIEQADFYRDADIELWLGNPVAVLDPEHRTVHTEAGDTWRYDACVLATGADPVRPSVDGTDHENVRVLRSAADGRALREAAGRARSAVVVGAGFIGCEAAVSLARRGVEVTVVFPDFTPQQARLGDTAGKLIAGWLVQEGVRLLPRTSLRAVERGRVARLDSGDAIDADLVLLATGMRPNCALAEAAGLEVAHGRVRTDDGMRTSAPGVLAAGDVALAHNAAAGRALPVEHWGEAETMGSIAGRQAAGEPAHWANAPGFWSVLGERVLKYASWDDGFDRSEVVHHADGGFTVWYGNRGTVVGVLTHEADEDYARGTELIEAHAAFPRTG